jgi:predicted ATPase/transcriptional regulator with XRE-family HTH domain
MVEGLGSRIRQLREAAGLSQEELAEASDLSANAVGAIERGERRRPYPATVRRLADAFGLSDADRALLIGAPGPPATAAAGRRPPPDPEAGATEGAGAGSVLPAPAGLGGQATTLPRPLDRLVGREREVEVTSRLLLRPDTCLLTLTGPGGIGKTRLALEVAGRVADAFPDGVYLVPLAPLTDPAQVPTAIAQALGAREAAGRDPLQHLAGLLRGRRALLVLDNVEHVVQAAPGVAELLAGCPGLTVLATSRSGLRVRGEQEYRVPPLGFPADGDGPDAETLLRSPSVALFVERGRSVLPGFALTADNASAVGEICRRLDGLPLAIELAAARLALLPPPALLTRLDTALQMLTGAPRDLPARQRTMRDTVAWSHDLLSAGARVVFRRLAVVAGGCTLEAADEICVGDGVSGSDVLDHLAELLDGSLLQREPDAASPEPRVVILETIRAYAGEQLAAAGEERQVGRRHSAHYAKLAATAGPQLMGPDQVRWLDRLHRDRHNLRVALRSFLDEGDARQAVEMTWALWRYWWVRGLQREARGWMREALTLDSSTSLPPTVTARALLVSGSMAWSEGDASAAADELRDALNLLEGEGDPRAEAIGRMMLGLALLGSEGRGEQGARSHFEASRREFSATGERWGEAFTAGFLGFVSLRDGDVEVAEASVREGLSLARRSGDLVAMHQSLYGLGLVSWARGDHLTASAAFAEGLRMASTLGDVVNAGYFLKGLGRAAAFRGEAARAALLLGAADAMLAATGSPPGRYVGDPHEGDPAIAAARALLGEAAWDQTLRRGGKLSLEAAVAQALAPDAA